jgi:hypothetical protein
MATKRALSPKVAAVAAVAVVLATTGILLWERDSARQASPAAATAARWRTMPAVPAAPRPAAIPSSAPPALASIAVPPASSPAPDPFKAFLEAHRGQAMPAASQPAVPAPIDPFKAAMEAGRRPEPVPLVSPFGAPKQ